MSDSSASQPSPFCRSTIGCPPQFRDARQLLDRGADLGMKRGPAHAVVVVDLDAETSRTVAADLPPAG
jgi:hypothetical protein